MKLLKVDYLWCWLRNNALDMAIIETYIFKEILINASLGANFNDFLETLSFYTSANT
jgi:hypothetical protein